MVDTPDRALGRVFDEVPELHDRAERDYVSVLRIVGRAS